MKKWQKYLLIQIPIAVFILIRGFMPEKNKTPQVPYHLFFDFEKDEYNVNDLVTGDNLGTIVFNVKNDEIYFSIYGNKTSGDLLIGEYKNSYSYSNLKLEDYRLEKYKLKNLEFYAGAVGDWYTAIIMNLDNNDYHDYYKSDNKKRYLFYLEKNGDYNFSTKDESVYDLYSAFGACRDEMKYAAIFE